MLSEQHLSTNLSALQRAQGGCPTLSGLDAAATRVADDPARGLRIEIAMADGGWTALDEWDPAALIADVPAESQAILIGPALGHVLDALDTMGAAVKVIAIEPDPGVATLLLARRDWRSWLDSGRLRLITGPDYQGAVSAARFLDGMRPTPVLVNPAIDRHRPALASRARAVARQIQANVESNAIARRKFAGRYLLQTLSNLPVIAREGDAAALDGLFAGLPAVIVGAGPSLDENLDALARLQHRSVIVAADTTLRPLLAGGVEPHLVVGVDPSDLNARHLAGLSVPDGTWLAAEGSLHASAFPGFAHRTFVFKVSDHEPWPWFRQCGLERGSLRAWGSVVTSAFDLALRAGCNPIVFAGMDLAFTGMRPYCRNTIYDAQWQSYVDAGCTWQQLMDDYFSRQPDVRQMDVLGAEVRTAPHLVSFRDWLVEQMAADRARRFVNATGAGILTGGPVHQGSLDEILGGAPFIGDEVRSRLRRAHSAGRGAADLRDALGQLSTPPNGTPVVDRWVAFSAGTLDADAIRAHVRTLLA